MIDIVWIQSGHSEVFSKGTDLKYLLTLILEKKQDEALQYLQQVQQCALSLASYNKPTITFVGGEVSGSAAAIAANSVWTTTKGEVHWWTNEPLYGFVPHGGASYVFSRMPTELGVFLALTGERLTGPDLHALQLAKYKLENDDSHAFSGAIGESLYYDKPGHTQNLFGNMFQQKRKQQLKGQAQYQGFVEREIQQRMFNPDADINEDPRSVYAEILYRNQLLNEANIQESMNSVQETQHKQVNTLHKQKKIQNYLRSYEEGLLTAMQKEGFLSVPTVKQISCSHPAIIRCFSANSLEEIIERLKAENSEWADNVLKRLQIRSPLCLKLTLRLIRMAEKATYTQCLENEFTVMSNLVNHQDLAIGIRDRNYQWSKRINQISSDEVESFFSSKAKLQHDAVENALIPTKQYYLRYPDNVRKFLNEQNVYGDIHARAAQEVDVLAFLKNVNLPFNDKSIGAAHIRRVLVDLEENTRQSLQRIQKMTELCSSQESLGHYYREKVNYIQEQFDNQPEKVQQLIDKAIENAFEKKFSERMASYSHIASTKLYRDKQAMISRIRNSLLNRRLTTAKAINPDQWQGMDRMAFFPKDDKVSFLESYNESLEDTTLFKRLYSRFVGKKNSGYESIPQDAAGVYRYKLGGQKDDLNDYFHRAYMRYENLYGNPHQEYNLEQYLKNLQNAGAQSQELKKYLNEVGETQANEILSSYSKVTNKQIADEIKLYSQYLEKKQALDEKVNQDNKANLNKEAQTLIANGSFPDRLEQAEQHKLFKSTQTAIQKQLNSLITSEQSLLSLLKPVLTMNEKPSITPIQKKYHKLLVDIYESKLSAFLTGGRLINFKEDKPAFIDKVLGSEIEQDTNKLIEPHLFFTFAYVVIHDLAKYYDIFEELATNARHSPAEFESKLVPEMESRFGWKLQTHDDVFAFLSLLDQLKNMAVTLLLVYKDHIQFSSEAGLNAFLQLKFKRAAEQTQGPQGFLSIVADQVKTQQKGWTKELLMHQIENSHIVEEPQQPNHLASLQSMRAHRLLKYYRPDKLKTLIPGYQYYLQQIDQSAIDSLRKNQQVKIIFIDNQIQSKGMQEVQETIDSLQDVKVYDQSQSKEDWFFTKIQEAVLELFNYRRKQEMTLNSQDLVRFDIEFSRLFTTSNFQTVLISSLDRELEYLGEITNLTVAEKSLKEADQIKEFRGPVRNYKKTNNSPLLLTTLTTRSHFDKNVSYYQQIPTDGMLLAEVELPPHPSKRDKTEQEVGINHRELQLKARRIRQELTAKLDPILSGLYNDDLLATKIRKNLEFINERIANSRKHQGVQDQ